MLEIIRLDKQNHKRTWLNNNYKNKILKIKLLRIMATIL